MAVNCHWPCKLIDRKVCRLPQKPPLTSGDIAFDCNQEEHKPYIPPILPSSMSTFENSKERDLGVLPSQGERPPLHQHHVSQHESEAKEGRPDI